MTRDEIIEMARQAGLIAPSAILQEDRTHDRAIEAFAKLVAAKEREASAKELDEISKEAKNVAPNGYVWKTIKECAEVIRARSSSRGEA